MEQTAQARFEAARDPGKAITDLLTQCLNWIHWSSSMGTGGRQHPVGAQRQGALPPMWVIKRTPTA
jgi:hypothetical protein